MLQIRVCGCVCVRVRVCACACSFVFSSLHVLCINISSYALNIFILVLFDFNYFLFNNLILFSTFNLRNIHRIDVQMNIVESRLMLNVLYNFNSFKSVTMI